MGGDAIDQACGPERRPCALQRRGTTAGVREPDRRELLLDSRDEPWSAAERLFHRLLRTARDHRLESNQPVMIDGSTYYVDVVFRRLSLVIEIDGRLYHTATEVFETDRWRQNLLVLDGWCVLRFTWTMMQERPDEVGGR